MNTVILLTLCQSINVGASHCRDVQLPINEPYIGVHQCQMSGSAVQRLVEEKLRTDPRLVKWQVVGRYKCADGDTLRQTAKI